MSTKGEKHVADNLTWDEIEKLYNVCMGRKDYCMASFFILGSYYGMTIGQMQGLTWSDIFDDVIMVKKNGRAILLPNQRKATELLKEIYNLWNSPPLDRVVLNSNKCKPITTQRINVKCKFYQTYLGEPTKIFTTHSLRKGFGAHLYSVCPDEFKTSCLATLKTFYGHTSIDQTMDYIGLPKIREFTSVFGMMDTIGGEIDTIKKIDGLMVPEIPSYIYLCQDSSAPDMIKIGKSNNPQQREDTLYSQKPTISMFKVYKCTSSMEAFRLEKKLHSVYDSKRVRGEWFNLSKEDLKEILSAFDWVDYEDYINQKIEK